MRTSTTLWRLGWAALVALAPVGCIQPPSDLFAVDSSAGPTSQAPTPPSVAPQAVPRPVRAPDPPYLVLSDSKAGLDGPSLTQLKLSAVRDLWVRAVIDDTNGLRALTATFVAPTGEIFHQQRFLFSTDDKVARVLAPAGQDVDVLHPRAVQAHQGLDVMIPIAGSNFDRYGLPGAWTARVEVERAGQATLALQQPFDLDVRR